MTEYKKVGSKTIAGKKAPVSVYKKNGSNKLYVKRNGLMISYVSYKKSFAKKLLGKTLNKVKKPNQKTRRRYTMGGDCANMKGGMYELFNAQNVDGKNSNIDAAVNTLGNFFDTTSRPVGLDNLANGMKTYANPVMNAMTGSGHMKKYKKNYQRFGGNMGYGSELNGEQDGGKRHKRIVKKNLKKRVVKK